jgi:hypothetical protein
MAARTILEQYKYETEERGLSHREALAQMVYMFDAAHLDIIDDIYQAGYFKGKDDAY